MTLRMIAGAVVGAAAWPVLASALPILPIPIRFLLPWALFTFGPGIAVSAGLTRDLDPLLRVIVALGVGSAATPVLIDVLGRMNMVAAFPYIVSALAVGGAATWRRVVRLSLADAAACGVLLALAAGLGAVVFWHRLGFTGGGMQVFGDYDSADLGYYAAVASEASHTVPPTASYYSGHQLNAAYYPHLVLAMIQRFAGVPVSFLHYRYAWPTFLALGALTAFTLVRALASRSVALLSVVLILVGSDFSYLAAWFLPHAGFNWDYLLWPTNFFSPTMQVLHFSTWTPSLPVFFTALYAIVRGIQTRAKGWVLLSAILIGILFEFKPFAYVVLMAALCASAVFSNDWPTRRRFAATVGLSVLFTLPFLLDVAALDPSARRTKLLIDFFMLPQRMLIKIDLAEAFMNVAKQLAPWAPMQKPVFLLLATIVFLAVGVGVRWIGAPQVWRAIRPNSDPHAAAWRLLGWVVVAGVLIPFVLITDPYVDTLQFYLTGLYLMWMFTAVALIGFARTHRKTGGIVIALAIAAAFPSSLHYLSWKWTEAERPPRAALTPAEVTIAEYLRTSDPESTVILHDRPLSPSLTAIVAARRIVLGWDVRYSAVGGESRLRDVNAFYGSANGNPDEAMETLRRYHVTHVIVRGDDRVHPAVLARLKPILQLPDVTLYEVPPLTES